MRIAQYLYGQQSQWGSINPDALGSGLGGRETAAIQLALQWAGRFDCEVTTFCATALPWHESYENGGSVAFVDIDLAAPMLSTFPYDVIVSWEDPSLFALPRVKELTPVKICALQFAHVQQVGLEALSLPDAYVALSPWHADFLEPQLPNGARIGVIPNGVDIDVLYERDPRVMKQTDPSRRQFLYASSPDRGLHHVFEAWPRIYKDLGGQATLHVAYGTSDWTRQARWLHNIDAEMALAVEEGLTLPGVVNHGRIGQRQLRQLHYECDALLYPCDPLQPTETGCITVIEACAAGNVPIISDADCLGSEFDDVAVIHMLPFNAEEYAAMVVSVVSDKDMMRAIIQEGREFAVGRDWNLNAEMWLDMMRTLTPA